MLQLSFLLIQRLGICFIYIYYIKTIYTKLYMYIYIFYVVPDWLRHARIMHLFYEYLVLYYSKTIFCLAYVLHSTFLKTWDICLNSTLNSKCLRVYSKQRAAGVSSRGKLNIPPSESFITSEQLRWEVCLSFDITCWTLLPQQTALNCNFFSSSFRKSESQPLRWKCVCVCFHCWVCVEAAFTAAHSKEVSVINLEPKRAPVCSSFKREMNPGPKKLNNLFK